MTAYHDQLQSPLAPTIAQYVSLKQALGRRFETPAYFLLRLDRFLALAQAPDLDGQTFSAWCSSLSNLSANGRRQRMRIVFRFCQFRRRSEPGCFVPDPSQFPPLQPRCRPHIFTQNEIARLLLATESLSPHSLSPLHRQVARLALVLLFTSGLRRGERVRLTLGDYNAQESVLLVRDSKFHKSRLIPLSEGAALEMASYLRDRLQPGRPCSADSPLLLNGSGALGAYTGAGMADLIRKIFRLAGIRTAAGSTPRVHDLRFSFAVHALLRWYQAGSDVQTRLPALATYMGHVSIASTRSYVKFVDALSQAASDRFERHCARFLSLESPSGGVQ